LLVHSVRCLFAHSSHLFRSTDVIEFVLILAHKVAIENLQYFFVFGHLKCWFVFEILYSNIDISNR